MMKNYLHLLLISFLSHLLVIPVFATGDLKCHEDKLEKTFIKDNQRMPDQAYQEKLREGTAWKSFVSQHAEWQVEFNEENAKPHRAYGTGIPTTGTSLEDRAMHFIQGQLNGFGVPVNDLILMGSASSRKHHHVNYYQEYKTLKVLGSRLTVKMTKDYHVIMFGLDVYDDINIDIKPTIDIDKAIKKAEEGIENQIISSTVNPSLFVLPVPGNKKNQYHLVYEIEVKTTDEHGIPANYQTWVDANANEVLYRNNLVKHHTPAMTVDVNMEATLYTSHTYNPSSVENLPNLRVVINGSTYYTDNNGQLTTNLTSTTTGQFYMEGLWSSVRNNGTTPSFSTSLTNGSNTVSFDSDALIQERSAYFHVNTIHDYMKSKIPTFTGMDFSLPTNVDDNSGTCNAFYNGSSINFYADGGGCLTYANVADVVYHEYGHGINDNFYSDMGSNFQNGAMGEGYADFWAYAITENPILGVGGDDSDPNAYIRRYDIDPKIYPKDLVGQVHADGEIIAGAWWDLYLNLGNDMNTTVALFVDAYYGLQAATFNGNEGQAFRDVLLDVLQADDNDGNLNNGTPNSSLICNAFGIHGITLISNATLSHSAVIASGANVPITVDATLNISSTTYLGDVRLYYKTNNSTTYSSVVMTNTSGNNYTADIPAQQEGTVVAYYMGVEDNICGYLSAVKPIGCADPDPNMPYFILVGYTLDSQNDFDFNNFSGSWTFGLPTDDASTGQWEINSPLGSFSDPGDTSTCVAPYYQHTPGGFSCALTQKSSSASAAIGERDVDDGLTTLETPELDLSNMLNPVISYHRWYINDPPSGANPGNDWWVVKVSEDGNTWVTVEATKISDKRWRRFAFRVADYITPTSTVQVRFHASDSLWPGSGLTFDGGSLVEAAVDDIEIWEQVAQSVQFTTTDVSCNGDCDGTATASASGGSAPFTYVWNTTPAQNSAMATGLCAGSYTVSITDGGGNLSVGSVSINEPTALSASVTGTDPSCSIDDGTATATPSGGTAPYTYSWNTGGTTSTITGLGTGTYTVMIFDTYGCSLSSSVTITAPTPPTVSVSGTDPSSCGVVDGTVTATPSGGATPYTYSWSNGGSTASITGLSSGTFSVTVTDANACTVTGSATITTPGAPSLTLTNTDLSCNGDGDGTASVTATGGTAPYFYIWSNGSAATSISSLSGGVYTVTVTDDLGCEVTGTVTVVEPSAISISTSVTDVTCPGGNDGAIDATVSGGTSPYGYSWSNGNTSEDVTGLASGSYMLDITDDNGCVASDSAVVNETSTGPQTGSVTGLNQVTENDQEQYSVTSTTGSSYTWTVTGGTILSGQGTNSIQVQWGSAGVGSVSVVETDAFGCEGTAVSLEVTIGTPIGIESQGVTGELLVFPNPFSHSTTVQFANESNQPHVLVIHDMLGNLVRVVKDIRTNQVEIEKGQLSAGLYILQLQGVEKTHRARIMID